jgi:type IV fimbrial biogenesis protein FimT
VFLIMIRATRGFTLIELIMAVAIAGILIVLGIPSFNEWIHNTQVRNAAEGALNGLQIARSEAVRRNGYTQFILGPGSGWRVVALTPPSGGVGAACEPIEEIQRRDGSEGSSTATVTALPAGVNTVTFTPLGWVGTGTTSCGNVITQIDFDSATLAAERSRELRIVITAGGGIRLCDPQVAAGDPRAC